MDGPQDSRRIGRVVDYVECSDDVEPPLQPGGSVCHLKSHPILHAGILGSRAGAADRRLVRVDTHELASGKRLSKRDQSTAPAAANIADRGTLLQQRLDVWHGRYPFDNESVLEPWRGEPVD
jgi:hypothetical protein